MKKKSSKSRSAIFRSVCSIAVSVNSVLSIICGVTLLFISRWYFCVSRASFLISLHASGFWRMRRMNVRSYSIKYRGLGCTSKSIKSSLFIVCSCKVKQLGFDILNAFYKGMSIALYLERKTPASSASVLLRYSLGELYHHEERNFLASAILGLLARACLAALVRDPFLKAGDNKLGFIERFKEVLEAAVE